MEVLTKITVLTILAGVLFVSYGHCQTDVRQSIPLSVTPPQSSLSDDSSRSDSSLEVTLSSDSSTTVITSPSENMSNSSSPTEHMSNPTSPSQYPKTTDAVVTSKLSTQEILSDVSTAATQSSVLPPQSPVMMSTEDPTKSTTTKNPSGKKSSPGQTLSTADMVAVICGCLLVFVTVLLYVIDGLILKYVKTPDLSGTGITKRAGDAAFYEGLHPQSAQTLVGAMSSQSFASSPSVDHLNSMGHAVYYNRGYEIDQHTDGPHHPVVQFDLSAPGARGSKKNRSSFNQSSA